MPPKVSRPRRRPRIAPVLHSPDATPTSACHDALRAEPFWPNLRLDGFMPISGSDTDILELRRCPQCGASIAKRVPRLSVLTVLHDTSGVVSRSLHALASSGLGNPQRSKDSGPG